MANTLISDIVVPELFNDSAVERTTKKSRLFASNVISVEPSIQSKIQDEGASVNIPFYKALSGSDQVLSDSAGLTTKKITTSRDFATVLHRGDSWSVNDLAAILTDGGQDPLGVIIDLVGDYWAEKHQETVVSTLKGVFDTALASSHNVDVFQVSGTITAANLLTRTVHIKAKQLLGDSKTKLTVMVAHSAVISDLDDQDQITFEKDSQGIPLQMYRGMELIEDDEVGQEVVDGKPVYHTYLFGPGAFAYATSTDNTPIAGGIGTWNTEFARVGLQSDSIFINRRRFVLCARGVKFDPSAIAAQSATNAELEVGAQYTKVYEDKNIPMVRVRHNVGI